MKRRIEVSLGFCSLVCILGWIELRICLFFLVSLLVHELGHVVCIRLFRIDIYGISLKIVGVVIRHGVCSYGQEIICAAAGPFASMLLALLVLRRLPELAVISGALAAVNLLPIYPLDGGRILRSVLLGKMEEQRVVQLLSRVTFVLCCLLMTLACWLTAVMQMGIWPVFLVLVILCRVGDAGWSETKI